MSSVVDIITDLFWFTIFKIFFSITWRKNWGSERALCGKNLSFWNDLASHLLERYLELLYKAFWKWLIPTVVVEEKSGQAFLLDSQRTIQVASMLMHFIVTLGREKKYSSSLKMSVNRCQLWFHQLSKSRGGTGSVSTYFKNMNCSDTLSVGVLAFNFQVILILNDIHHLIYAVFVVTEISVSSEWNVDKLFHWGSQTPVEGEYFCQTGVKRNRRNHVYATRFSLLKEITHIFGG